MDGLFTKIDHGTTADEAVRQIEFLLLDGVLSSGDRLPGERELSEQLDISRPVLRGALMPPSETGGRQCDKPRPPHRHAANRA